MRSLGKEGTAVNARRRFSVLFAAALLAASTLVSGTASAAPGVISCQVNAILMLPQPENVLLVNGGHGTVSATLVCEGGTTSGVSLAGVSLNGGGDFRFCSHKDHGFECTTPVADAPDEDLADQASSRGAPVGHTQSDLISFTMNTGVTCTMGLNGHTYVSLAHIEATNFTCKSGTTTLFGPVDSTINDRVAEILVNPLLDCAPHPGTGLKVCFQQLTYQGQLVAHDPT